MAGVLGKAGVFCNSDNFLESLENTSPFCTVSGKLLHIQRFTILP